MKRDERWCEHGWLRDDPVPCYRCHLRPHTFTPADQSAWIRNGPFFTPCSLCRKPESDKHHQ